MVDRGQPKEYQPDHGPDYDPELPGDVGDAGLSGGQEEQADKSCMPAWAWVTLTAVLFILATVFIILFAVEFNKEKSPPITTPKAPETTLGTKPDNVEFRLIDLKRGVEKQKTLRSIDILAWGANTASLTQTNDDPDKSVWGFAGRIADNPLYSRGSFGGVGKANEPKPELIGMAHKANAETYALMMKMRPNAAKDQRVVDPEDEVNEDEDKYKADTMKDRETYLEWCLNHLQWNVQWLHTAGKPGKVLMINYKIGSETSKIGDWAAHRTLVYEFARRMVENSNKAIRKVIIGVPPQYYEPTKNKMSPSIRIDSEDLEHFSADDKAFIEVAEKMRTARQTVRDAAEADDKDKKISKAEDALKKKQDALDDAEEKGKAVDAKKKALKRAKEEVRKVRRRVCDDAIAKELKKKGSELKLAQEATEAAWDVCYLARLKSLQTDAETRRDQAKEDLEAAKADLEAAGEKGEKGESSDDRKERTQKKRQAAKKKSLATANFKDGDRRAIALKKEVDKEVKRQNKEAEKKEKKAAKDASK